MSSTCTEGETPKATGEMPPTTAAEKPSPPTGKTAPPDNDFSSIKNAILALY